MMQMSKVYEKKFKNFHFFIDIKSENCYIFYLQMKGSE